MFLGSKFRMLSITLLSFRNTFMLFHSLSDSPNILKTARITCLMGSGGFGRDRSSSRSLRLIPETAFFASSIKGWTSESSTSTPFFFWWIFCYSTCKAFDSLSVSCFLSVASCIAFEILPNASSASACLTANSFCFLVASADSSSTNPLASCSFCRPDCRCFAWLFFALALLL